MQALAGFLVELYRAPPPRIDADTFGEFLALANLGRKFRRLGRAGMAELLRTLPIPIADLLDDEFETPALKGAVSAYAVMDLAQGPTAAGTAFTLLHRYAALQAGAGERLTPANYEARARAAGVTIEANQQVRNIAVSDGRITGVVLESGEEITCRSVVSSLDPSRSLLELIDPQHHDPEFIHAVRNIRYRGVTTKILLALEALPTLHWPRDGASPFAGSLVVAPTIRHVERAYEATKYGRCSEEPFVEVRFPSVTQSRLAPSGRHVAVLHVQYTPYRLREGSWSALRDSLADQAIAQVDRHLPGFASLVLERAVLAPPDLESRLGLREGAVSQGEMALDQILFMRPVPAAARYATPIDGLFLCGAGTHPGAGMHGISGELAARAAAAR
jgi:phytoene dehydrogenase-like protein